MVMVVVVVVVVFVVVVVLVPLDQGYHHAGATGRAGDLLSFQGGQDGGHRGVLLARVGVRRRGQRALAVGEGLSGLGPQALAVAVLQGVLLLLLVVVACVVVVMWLMREVVHILTPVRRGRVRAVTLAEFATPACPHTALVRPLG